MIQPLEIPGVELEQELGRGGYSVVYRGRRGATRCAVKLARTPGTARWFRREAAALARVRDPGVPDVLDVGEAAGCPYLVMELVEGETLAERLRRGELPEREVLELGRALARTLAAVHARGLVHRDIKPHNIVLESIASARSRLGSVGDAIASRPASRICLVDFGLATRVGPSREGSGAGGTAGYAAPEQLSCPHVADARADLYALGRVLGECLGTARSHGAALVRVLAHLVADDPRERYASATDLLRELERIERGEEIRGPRARRPGEDDAATAPLVGRAAELSRLTDAWAEARGGRGGAWLLAGASGSGKTRLLAALARNIGAPGAALALRTQGMGAMPQSALRPLVDGYFDLVATVPDARRRPLEAALQAAARGPAQELVASLSPRLAALLGNPTPAHPREPEAFAEATAAFLLAFAREAGPVLLVVDDLQWLDPVSREVLVRVALGARGAPLLFVAASRDDARAQPPVLRLASALGERLETMALPAFGRADVAELIGAYLGADEPEPALAGHVVSLAGGTPLGVLENLEALVDAGALRPYWGRWLFDAELAQRSTLPHGAPALLERRLGLAPAATQRVLEAAAVVGRSFDEALVAAVVGVTADDLRFALGGASRSGLIDRAGERWRFVHESVRDAVLRGLSAEGARDLHDRTAEVLFEGAVERGSGEREALFALADHLAAGDATLRPRRAYETLGAAAVEAAVSLDHETALRYLELGADRAAHAGIALDLAHHRATGEAHLQLGDLDASQAALARALELARESERTAVLARIAWVHQMKADGDRAWAILARAFEALGERMPSESPGALTPTLLGALRARLPRLGQGEPSSEERERLELLCALHYQCARLGVECGKPVRTVVSALAILALGSRIGPSPALARAQAMYGVFATALGRRQAGVDHIRRGRALAERLADPASIAQTVQHELVAACWSGEIERALSLSHECLDQYGPWLEVSEYCLCALSPRFLESLRGRHREAWAWIERAVARVRRHNRKPAVYSEVVVPIAAATLTILGRGHEARAYPAGAELSSHGLHRLCQWGPRAVLLAETGGSREDCDALERAFRAEGHNPRTGHIALSEYYVSLANARAHLCRHARPNDRAAALRDLDRAIADVRKAARIPLLRAHLCVLEGERALATGDHPSARRLFAEAEALGEQESAPAVLFGAACGSATLLTRTGKQEMARHRTLAAAILASELGTVGALRRVREELELAPSAPHAPTAQTTSSTSGSSLRRSQLNALLQVASAGPREPRLDHQARAVLDELLRVLAAHTGMLLFERAGAPAGILVACNRLGGELDVPEESARARLAAIRDGADDPAAEDDAGPSRDAPQRTVSRPLFLHDEPVGALYLERGAGDAPFVRHEIELVTALSLQVPIALELSRVLEERDRMHEQLGQSQHLESLGLLARGVAHDFDNMTWIVEGAASRIKGEQSVAPRGRSDLDLILDACARSKELTRQLMAFAKRQELTVALVDVNQVVAEIVPMLRRVLPSIAFRLERASEHAYAWADRASLDQALVNLAVNAYDAGSGRVTFEVGKVVLEASPIGVPRTGPYVSISVTDTGTGMSPEVRAHVFEPFFTTKEPGVGTGLGLSSVYGFVKQSGGHIEVESELGHGTTLRLYLPATEAVPDEPVAPTLQ